MGASIKTKSKLWPSAIIPYVIDANFTELNRLNQAIQYLENSTNLRFVKRQPHESKYVVFLNDARVCESNLGRQRGQTFVKCVPVGTSLAPIIHEIGHAIGLIHEHVRSDRDNYVIINFDNIINTDDIRENFKIVKDSRNSRMYDYKSIMHYPEFSQNFSIDSSKPMIEPKDPANSPLNNSTLPTNQDINFINSIYPHRGIIRRSDSGRKGAGYVREISTVYMGADPFDRNADSLVTAVKTRDRNLKLIIWRINSQGGIVRLSDSGNQARRASRISITRIPGRSQVVTAFRNGGRNLMLISWSTSGNMITSQEEARGGRASQIKILSLSSTLLLTACRASDGRLLLITWSINNNGDIGRIHDSGYNAGSVSEISMCILNSSSRGHLVATTVRTSNGSAKTIVWNISLNGRSITRRGDSANQMGTATQIQSTINPYNQLIVSLKTGDSSRRLKLIALSISTDGRIIERIADTGNLAGRISRNALIQRNYGVLSVVTTGGGDLKLIKWYQRRNGIFVRIGDSGDQASTAKLLDVSQLSLLNVNCVTPVRTSSDDLKLISWDDDPSTGEL